MDRLAEFVESHATIGLDTPLFIYHLEDVEPYASRTAQILSMLVQGGFVGVTSVISLMEITVQPLARGAQAVALEYEAALSRLPNLTILPITQMVARRAAALRAVHRLRPADALQIGACITHGATGFISNDRGLRRVQDIDVLILADLNHT